MALVVLSMNVLILSARSTELSQAILLTSSLLGAITATADLPSLYDTNTGSQGIGVIFLIFGYFCILTGAFYNFSGYLSNRDQMSNPIK